VRQPHLICSGFLALFLGLSRFERFGRILRPVPGDPGRYPVR